MFGTSAFIFIFAWFNQSNNYKMERTIRIMQTTDNRFYIQEYKEFERGATFKKETVTTGRWPFKKTKTHTTRIPRMVWFTWYDFTQPKVYNAMAEEMRHPFYLAETLRQARDHAKKVLADAIKYPMYHEL